MKHQNHTIKCQSFKSNLILPFLIIVFLTTCIWSCKENEEDTLNVSTSEIMLDEKDEGQFSILTNTSWQIRPTDSWVQLSKYSGSGSDEILVSAKSKNNELETRKVSLTITAGSLSKPITISQKALPKLEVDSTIINFTAKENENKFHITANQEWTASSNEKWCLLKQTKGNTSTTVNVVAETNESLSSREAEITVKSTSTTCKIKVRQAGAEPFVKPETNRLTFGAEAASKSVSISSNVAWTAASSNTEWCTIKKENNSITVSVKKNETIEERKAIITIKGEGTNPQEIEVVQTAGEGYLTVSKSQMSFSPAAAEETFSISSNMKWTVSSDQSWCSVSNSSGQNNASLIKVKVTRNTTNDDRNAVITIKGETGISHQINVNQAKPVLTVNTNDITFTSSGGTVKRDVTSNISWTAKSSTSWCTVSYTTTSLTIVATENITLTKRTATISITGDGMSSKNIQVSQDAGSPKLEVSPSSLKFYSQAGSKSLKISTNMAWEATSDQTWCIIASKGNGDAIKSVSVLENTTNNDRKAKIVIKAGELSRTISVEQEKHATLSVSEHSFSVSEIYNTKSVNISTNTNWEIESSQSWCRVSKSSGSGNANITIYIDSNSTSYERTATLTITGGGLSEKIVISQKETISITVSPKQLEYYYYSGGIKSVYLTCNSNISWEITAPKFITVTPSSGSGSATLKVVDAYAGGWDGGTFYIYVKDKKYNETRATITVKIK